MNDKWRTAWFFFVVIAALIAYFAIAGCAMTDSNKRERLEAEHPDCFVMQDFTLECPNPFVDSSAGFGLEVQTQKTTNASSQTKGKKDVTRKKRKRTKP